MGGLVELHVRDQRLERSVERADDAVQQHAGSLDSGRTIRPACSSGRNRLNRSIQDASDSRSADEASVRSHSMPKAPNSAVAARKSRDSVRCVVWEVGAETCAPAYSGATSWVVQRWIC